MGIEEISTEELEKELKKRKEIKNRLSIKEVAKLMDASEQFIRMGLKQGVFPWGYAVKMGGKYSYFISAEKFTEHTGIKVLKKDEEEDKEIK